jgi:hypothetical protein
MGFEHHNTQLRGVGYPPTNIVAAMRKSCYDGRFGDALFYSAEALVKTPQFRDDGYILPSWSMTWPGGQLMGIGRTGKFSANIVRWEGTMQKAFGEEEALNPLHLARIGVFKSAAEEGGRRLSQAGYNESSQDGAYNSNNKQKNDNNNNPNYAAAGLKKSKYLDIVNLNDLSSVPQLKSLLNGLAIRLNVASSRKGRSTQLDIDFYVDTTVGGGGGGNNKGKPGTGGVRNAGAGRLTGEMETMEPTTIEIGEIRKHFAGERLKVEALAGREILGW